MVQIDTGLTRLMDGIETGLSSISFKIELLTSAIVRADWFCLCDRFATIVLVPLVCYNLQLAKLRIQVPSCLVVESGETKRYVQTLLVSELFLVVVV